jgi:hypothetical protein
MEEYKRKENTMVAVCERDCHGPAKLEDIPFGAGERTNRGDIANMKWQMFVRGQEYDIDLESPVAIHFRLSPEDFKIARKAHFARVKKAKEDEVRRKALGLEGFVQTDPFGLGGPEAADTTEAPRAEEKPAPAKKKRPVVILKCSECGKECKGPLALFGHMKSHKK